jgi:RNA polymerase sigma-70 factor (ECF subfamily)
LHNEKKLIRRIQKHGDRTAADTLIRGYYDEIYIYVVRQISDPHTAMDITQDIFISMLQTISRYDGKQAAFRTWLYKVATNKVIDYHRSRGGVRHKTLDLDDVDIPDEADFVKQLANTDLTARIDAYVGSFDTDIQRIFRLKIFGDYTFAQIAVMTGVPENTVKTKYYRMLKTIRKEFGHEYQS